MRSGWRFREKANRKLASACTLQRPYYKAEVSLQFMPWWDTGCFQFQNIAWGRPGCYWIVKLYSIMQKLLSDGGAEKGVWHWGVTGIVYTKCRCVIKWHWYTFIFFLSKSSLDKGYKRKCIHMIYLPIV
jgi:hypothetical protein